MNRKSNMSICLDSESSPYSFTSPTTNVMELFSSNISLTRFKKFESRKSLSIIWKLYNYLFYFET
ncbi:hypothetical protein BpHYR1_029261 [Brachionus plicatilis]|uniref:Uncharacterized protein n=1 Tax=Brachionus plicatilis TaxID=10195 RepID=A0A3M7S2G2_BRAPC|nr:hypothetical protein BpHYR1_029261 [Brachionus plicatilis]